MSAPRNYPTALRERSVRLVFQAPEQEPGLSLTAAGPGGARHVVPDTLAAGAIGPRSTPAGAPGVKHAQWAHTDARVHHYRDGRDEIDLVAESRSGDVAAIEINASASPDTASRRALTQLRDATTNRFRAGIVLYIGRPRISLGYRP